MSKTVRIAPSILAADFTRLGQQIGDAEAAGADRIHIDVMDGCFVPNITMGPLVVEAARRATQIPLDVHLMIVEPEKYIEAFAKAGADIITVHVETCPHLHRVLQNIAEVGCRPGIALNPHTPASSLTEVMHLPDVLLVMTVNPGFGGQAFLPETLSKIATLRAMAQQTGRVIDIEVDGGINVDTANAAIQAGADVLVAGSAIFNDQFSVQAGLDALVKSIETADAD